MVPWREAKEDQSKWSSYNEWTAKELEMKIFDAPPKERRNVIWIHLHNFAGTNICVQARRRERISKKNCNWPGDGVAGQGWGKPYAHLARCPERAQSKQITFSMIERGLEAGDLGCDGIVTGILLRDPFHGARSTVLYNGFKMDLPFILEAIEKKRALSKLMNGHNGLPGWDTYQHFDNFAVRTLSGHYGLPPGAMTEDHLQKAKEALQRVDVVMQLEEMNNQWAQLEVVFGWAVDTEVLSRNWNSHSSEAKAEAVSPSQEEQFKRLNQLDYQLFEFGKLLAANRTRAAKAIREGMA